MNDRDKTKEELIHELTEMHRKCAELEASLATLKQTDKALRESEERFRAIFENDHVVMLIIDPETGRIEDGSPGACFFYGYDREDLRRMRIMEINLLDSDHALERLELAKSQQRRYFDYRHRLASGEIRDVEVCSGPIVIGGRTLLFSVINDVTDLKRAEEETRRTRLLLNSIIENLPTAVFLKDADELKYLLWNQASEKLYGYGSEEVMGKSAHDFFPSEQADRFNEQDREALASGKLLCVPEQNVNTRHKGVRVLHSKKLPILDEAGRPRYLVGISEDITDRKTAEKDLVQAREAAERASLAKSEFLANMSHEIRTPINGIMGMTQLALNTELTGEQREYLEAVELSADSLLRVINDILDFSKIEARKLDLIAIDFNLRDCIADAMTTLAVQAHTKGLELVYHVPSTIPDALIGDPGRLRQIIVNLVGNSIKFTREGEIAVKVELESKTADQVNLHISVADSGIGIPAEKQENIFQSFEQADSSTTREFGGTGLGLAISSQLVRMMGGQIRVESEVNKGSLFHFVACFGLQKEPIQPQAIGEGSDLKDISVLVVDDNATNRKILEETLLYWGMKPTVMENGRAALVAMAKAYKEGRHFDLIITDCMMPEMDGFELAERISKDPDLTTTTIIMLTSAGERGDAARCLKLGISAYLLKPIRQSELLFTISKVLNEPTPTAAQPSLITRHSIRESKRQLHILLAEDNAVNQKLATRMLERMGHTVIVASNGKKVLECLEHEKFDLILMDVQMPEMDGLQATRAVRELEKATGEHIPIVAMTAYAMKGDKEKCLEAGMDGYVAKPINAQELFETIENLLGAPNVEATPFNHAGQALDKSQILDQVGGDKDLLKEVVALFLDDCPKLIEQMREAIQESNPEGLQKAAHTLKGSVSNFGATLAVQAALDLETMGKTGDIGGAAGVLEVLEKEIDRVREELISLKEEIDQSGY